MKTTRREFISLVVVGVIVAGAVPTVAATGKTFLKFSGNGVLYRVYPDASREKKDSLLLLELKGAPYERGLQHGRLLAEQIADVIGNRYTCVGQDVLEWTQAAYDKMPSEFREEIRGIADGLSANGYDFPLAKIVLHAVQPLTGFNFPWFICPWDEGSGPTGSFSYAVWGRYTPTGTALSINSPDWGAVPKSLARNRVLISVRPSSGFRYAYLGVAGVIGMPGVNETGLSIAGTAGHIPVSARTAMPGNGVPIPDGFMSPFMVGAHVLRTLNGSDPPVFNKVEEILHLNPPDGFILQVTTPTSSVLWESGAAASLDYPYNSRREAGEWDAGDITPVDWRGDILLLPDSVLRLSALPFPVAIDARDSAGEAYAGRAWIHDVETRWQRRPLGRAFVLPSDSERANRFANWFANLGVASVAVPYAVNNDGTGEGGAMPHIVSVLPDKTGGHWVLADGSDYGSWVRDGDSAFRAYNSDGTEACTGQLYDFGVGVTGWCSLGASTDTEWVAWTHQYPDGAFERLDGMNLSMIPEIKPLARMRSPFFGGPHSRTHFLLRELGEPKGTLSLEEVYKTFQRTYFSVGGEDQPFGVGAYDLSSGEALFTVSRYEGDQYIGGLNPEQKPIRLNRFQLFGR